jgi:lysozyme
MFDRLRNHPIVQKHASKLAWLPICLVCVAGFEGLYTHPYYDSVHVRTVCYGETAADHVNLNRNYTPDECKDLLAGSLPKYNAQVQKCLKPEVYDALPPHLHAAIVSFTYNVGGGAFCKSSVARDLNNGNVIGACNALLLYNRGGGRIIKGLTNRRYAERKLCLEDD